MKDLFSGFPSATPTYQGINRQESSGAEVSVSIADLNATSQSPGPLLGLLAVRRVYLLTHSKC